jgi:hypothetical protein
VSRRYVECPACATADYRHAGSILDSEETYPDNCRACGAHLLGDKSKDFRPISQAATRFVFYAVNALTWTMIWFFALVIPICLAWDLPARIFAIAATIAWGAGWGLYRARKAHLRGEMFVKRVTAG